MFAKKTLNFKTFPNHSGLFRFDKNFIKWEKVSKGGLSKFFKTARVVSG